MDIKIFVQISLCGVSRRGDSTQSSVPDDLESLKKERERLIAVINQKWRAKKKKRKTTIPVTATISDNTGRIHSKIFNLFRVCALHCYVMPNKIIFFQSSYIFFLACLLIYNTRK